MDTVTIPLETMVMLSQPTVPNGLTKMEMVMETIRLETIQTHSLAMVPNGMMQMAMDTETIKRQQRRSVHTQPTQWFDEDGDGYGDNSNGNNPDLCLNTPSGQAVDSNGCSEQQKDDDLDGYQTISMLVQ